MCCVCDVMARFFSAVWWMVDELTFTAAFIHVLAGQFGLNGWLAIVDLIEFYCVLFFGEYTYYI